MLMQAKAIGKLQYFEKRNVIPRFVRFLAQLTKLIL
jgi:hypothetical protein